MVTRANCNFKLKETERLLDLKSGARERGNDDRVSLLYSAWSAVLKGSTTGGNDENEYYLQKLGIRGSSLPNAPHLENCKVKTQLYSHLDKRSTGNESFPPWTNWKGFLQTFPVAANPKHHQAVSEGAYPPWVRAFSQLFLMHDYFISTFRISIIISHRSINQLLYKKIGSWLEHVSIPS